MIHREGLLKLSVDQLSRSTNFLAEASHSATVPGGGVVIVDPKLNKIVSRSELELELQALSRPNLNLPESNPLVTPILLALQYIARSERERLRQIQMQMQMQMQEEKEKTGETDLDLDFSQGQYLSTGFDVYCGVEEPDVYECMALLHARVGRVFFRVKEGEGYNKNGGFLGLAGNGFGGVHCMESANHAFRVWACVDTASGAS